MSDFNTKSSQEMDTLKELIYSKVQATEYVPKLLQLIRNCDNKTIFDWTDDNEYDVMHHAIISGNIEAVQILSTFWPFKSPQETKRQSYIHVAANVGNKAILSMLLQQRPRDLLNPKSTFKWIKPPTELPVVTLSKNGTSFVTALDVASSSGNVGCVKMILDFCAVNDGRLADAERKTSYLCLACACHSPSALRLLVQQTNEASEIKEAVGTALKTTNAECLDILLSYNPNLTALFSGMNLFHVLYSYSSSLRNEWYERLLQVTSVLLKHRQNPMCALPFRTYPLYSLLCALPTWEFGRLSHYIIACLVVLINAGVNPNFNEVEFEKENWSKDIKTAFGRSAYSSAFHCLYDSVGPDLKTMEDDATGIRRYVTKCTETLLRHDADPTLIGPLGDSGLDGNALHAFLKIVILRGLDERSIVTFRLLMQNGANPDACVSDKYPLNIFCDEILYGAEEFDKVHKDDVSATSELAKEIVTTLLDNMNVTSINAAVKCEFDGKPTNDTQKRVFKIVKEEMQKRTVIVRSLKTFCRLKILECCRRRSTDVIKLPIPTALKSFINQC